MYLKVLKPCGSIKWEHQNIYCQLANTKLKGCKVLRTPGAAKCWKRSLTWCLSNISNWTKHRFAWRSKWSKYRQQYVNHCVAWRGSLNFEASLCAVSCVSVVADNSWHSCQVQYASCSQVQAVLVQTASAQKRYFDSEVRYLLANLLCKPLKPKLVQPTSREQTTWLQIYLSSVPDTSTSFLFYLLDDRTIDAMWSTDHQVRFFRRLLERAGGFFKTCWDEFNYKSAVYLYWSLIIGFQISEFEKSLQKSSKKLDKAEKVALESPQLQKQIKPMS